MLFLKTFIPIVGFIIAMGAATVIDCIGFLGRTSRYWTKVAIRAHRVTKPLIWLGTIIAALGLALQYWGLEPTWHVYAHAVLFTVLILNGLYLHFRISRALLRREKYWLDSRLLPRSLQRRIMVSMILSFVSWWSSLVVFIVYLTA